MLTYRRELEKRGWHRPWPLRLVLVVGALFLGAFGFLEWALEQEKGGWDYSGLGHFVVEDDPLSDRVRVRGGGGEILFEGAGPEEVAAWIESRRNRDFTGPMLLLAGSAVLFILGVAPSPRRPDRRDAERPVART